MSLLEKLNVGLAELEQKHGSSLPVVEVKQLVAKVCAVAPTVSSPKGQCSSFTKKDNKQCSKNSTKTGKDGKGYCLQHFKAAFPDEPVESKTAAAPKATPAPKVATGPKITVGNGVTAQSCNHHITGKNPRQCSSNGKNLAPDGKYYCGVHFKKFAATAEAKVTESKVVAGFAASDPVFRPDLGIAVDANGICFIEYNNMGACICGHLVGGDISEVTPEVEQYAHSHELTIIPSEERKKLCAMPPAERMKFINVSV